MKLFRAAMAAIPLAAFSPHPAKAGLLDNLIYGSPGDYARAFAQCAASTVTVHQELQCASNWLARRNISGLLSRASRPSSRKGAPSRSK